MFVISVRAGKKQILIAACILVCAVLAGVLLFRGGKNGDLIEAGAQFQTAASNAAERRIFLQQFGWEVETEPVEVCEVIIPEVFNEAYTQYNDLQRSQGFDLTPYSGKRVKRWTYQVTNYPDAKESVYANLLVLDGRVIGGDIGSAEQGGFMRTFLPDSENFSSSTVDPASGMEGIESQVHAENTESAAVSAGGESQTAQQNE